MTFEMTLDDIVKIDNDIVTRECAKDWNIDARVFTN